MGLTGTSNKYRQQMGSMFAVAAKDQGSMITAGIDDLGGPTFNLTAEQQALETIHVPENLEPEEWAKYRTDRRRFLVLCRWSDAEDKDAEVASLAQKWGLSETGIRQVIRYGLTMDKLPPELAAKVHAIQYIKRQQVFRDGERARSHLNSQIEAVEVGGAWVDDEKVVDDSEKGGEKTKKVAKGKVLRQLHREMQHTHRHEADALTQYMEKPATKKDYSLRVTIKDEASEEFREHFARMRELEKLKIEKVEVEEVKDGDQCKPT